MIKSLFNNIFHSIISIVCLVLIFFVVLFSNKAGEIELKAGDISPENIYAPRTVIDEVATNEHRKAERDKVPDRTMLNTESAVNDLYEVFSVAASLRAESGGSATYRAQLQEKIQKDFGFVISDEVAAVLLSSSEEVFTEFKRTPGILNDIIKNNNTTDVQKIEELFSQKLSALSVSQQDKGFVKNLISDVLNGNLEIDKVQTENARLAAEESVADHVIKKNQLIIGKGQQATQSQIDILTQLGLLKGTSPISVTYTIGVFLLMLVCYAVLIFYFLSTRKQNSLALPIASVVGLVIVILSSYGNQYLPEDLLPLLPLGIFPQILAIFSPPQTAAIANLVFSFLCGIAFEANWSNTVCLIIAGTIASYAFSAVKRRSHLLPAAMASSVVYGLVFFAMSFIEISNTASAFLFFLKGLLGGFLSGLITIGSIQFFEWIFGATTPMKLSDLANPENKLLKKLLVEAPGTYHHSLTVANISEIAARSIHADALLTRVGAYYHDIGKIRRPLYFKENQYDSNIHDELSPEDSSQIIINHVTAGTDIAQKGRLPKAICDIIAQHHGTTSTGYFLIRAKELNPDIDEASFRYPGPIPQTKEAAIVMLADSCEAAVRSIDEKNEEKIEAMVRQIAKERVNSGQLSQCNLTFAELEKVIKVITKTLGGYFHERIKYE